MNKSYQDLNEFMKINFPNIYDEKKASNDGSLETFMKKNSEIFKIKINNIINSESQTAHNQVAE